MTRNYINTLIKICLDSVIIAENIDPLDNIFLQELGLGVRTYSKYLRDGIKSLIDVQSELTILKNKNEMLKDTLETYQEILSIDDLEFLEDDDLKKIKEFIDKIVKEKEI